MADQLVEGSIYRQIEAIEAWAVEIYNQTKKDPLTKEDIDEIIEGLRRINLQARKLEWRGQGLKNLPKGQLTDDLKQKITQLRAAVVILRDVRKDWKRAGILSNPSLRNIRNLVSLSEKAKKLVEQFAGGLPDLSEIVKDKNELENFLSGQKGFLAYPLDVRRKLWDDFDKRKKIALRKLSLTGVDLRGFDFSKLVIDGCSFNKVNLEKSNFEKAWIKNSIFFGSNLSNASFKDFESTNVKFDQVNAEYADFSDGNGKIVFERSNLNHANLRNITIIVIGNAPSFFRRADLRNSTVYIDEALAHTSDFSDANVARASINVKMLSGGGRYGSTAGEFSSFREKMNRATRNSELAEIKPY